MTTLRGVAMLAAGFTLAIDSTTGEESSLAGARPTTLLVEDLDRDGAVEAVVGCATPSGGALVVHRGNLGAIFPRSPLPEVREALHRAGTSPFLPGPAVHVLPSPPQALAARDFDGDGHADLIAATLGDDGFWLLPGGEDGALGERRRILLPGALAALASGDLDRPDGASGLAIAVDRGAGTQLLLYTSPRGALLEAPETVSLPRRVRSLLVARLDGDAAGDVVAVAGGEAWLVPGRPHARVPHRLDLAEPVAALSAGSFLGERRPQHDLAYLTPSGDLRFARVAEGEVREVGGPRIVAALLAPAEITGGGTQDLLVLDASRTRLEAVGESGTRSRVELAQPPVALAAARLNEDGLDDLVMLREGEIEPVVSRSTAFATFTVNSAADQPDAAPGNGVCATAGGLCTLRAAIQETNTLAGADTIQFALGGGTPTIAPLSQLPAITGPVAILGDTGGASRIEISGAGAGAAAGLVLSANTSILRALVVNRFAFIGISVNGASNRIENCWIGLDAAGGASVAGNGGTGIDLNAVASQSSNTIGGALPSRNVIAHNGGDNVRVTRHGNAVLGNLIGTDAGGTVDVSTGVGVSMELGSGTNQVGGSTVAPGRPPGNLIAGNAEGIRFTGMSDSLVQGNLIGTDVSGEAGLPNGVGVIVEQSSQNNLIGGATADLRNVISANVSAGVLLFGPNNFGNALEGNWIGTDDTGDVALGNGGVGVDVNDVLRNRIGGPSPAAGVPPGNVIAGNGDDGIVVRGPGASTNTVQRNLVGTNADGTAALPNSGDGIELSDRASSTIIDGNVFSGNGFAGVRIVGASSNALTGNLVGADASGLLAMPNGTAGVEIQSAATPAQFNLVGGPDPAARNVISANSGDGVLVSGSTATGNAVLGNFIGTDAGGLQPLGNGGGGVRVANDASGNRIGGLAGATPAACAGECNVIAHNGLAGVSIEGALAAGNAVRNVAFHDNVFLGINLGTFGVTPNDPLDGDAGANGLQNFPVIEGAAFNGTNTTVTLRLRSGASATYEIDLYGNDTPDPSGHGEARTYLGSASCVTNGAGDCPLLTAMVPGEPVWIAATATAVTTQDTSELSGAFVNPDEASPALDLTASRGAGSTVEVVYTPSCGATDHAIYWGQTPIVGGLSWVASACGLGASGFATFNPGSPASGRAFYFVAVGQHATREGSYGTASSGLPRAEAVMVGACDRPMALTNTCP